MNGLRDSSVLAGNSTSLSSQLVTIFIHIDMIHYQVSKFKGCEVPQLWSFLGVKNLGCLSHNLLCVSKPKQLSVVYSFLRKLVRQRRTDVTTFCMQFKKIGRNG